MTLAETVKTHQVTLTSSRTGLALAEKDRDEWQRKADGWRCTLHYDGRTYSFDYWKGPGNRVYRNGQHVAVAPTATEALESLLSDASSADETFEDWCGEFGADTDSRKAYATWQACCESAAALRTLLADDFDAFLAAERD